MVEITEEKVNAIKALSHLAPFYDYLGMEVVDVRNCYAKLRIPWRKELLQVQGLIHGGVLATLCDSAVGVALLTSLDPEDITVTIELNVNYLLPVRAGEIVAEGRILHRGRRTALGDVEVMNEGNIVCHSSATYMIIKKEDRASTEAAPTYKTKKYRCDF
ncbi:MAG: PaaI family thioesterase [Candidatus Freyarchaeum deiterrae]